MRISYAVLCLRQIIQHNIYICCYLCYYVFFFSLYDYPRDLHVLTSSFPTRRSSVLPTLNIAVGGSVSGGQLSLRWIGSSNVSAAFDSAVARDFDGIVVSSMRLVQSGFFDVAQIDILKGPQSLYFGKSATAGVVSIRSAGPTSSLEASLRGSYEFEEKGYTVEGYVSGPIHDTDRKNVV